LLRKQRKTLEVHFFAAPCTSLSVLTRLCTNGWCEIVISLHLALNQFVEAVNGQHFSR